jgi:hypothetical protein
MEADISIWQKPGHFYFALTRVELGWEQCRLLTLARFGPRYLSETVRGPQ